MNFSLAPKKCQTGEKKSPKGIMKRNLNHGAQKKTRREKKAKLKRTKGRVGGKKRKGEKG